LHQLSLIEGKFVLSLRNLGTWFMTSKIFYDLLLSVWVISVAGCGGGSSAPAPSPEPVATQPTEVVPPVVTPNPPNLTQPAPAAPAAPATPAPVTPAPVTPAPVTPVTPTPVTPAAPVTPAPVAPIAPVTPVAPVTPTPITPSGAITSANSCGLTNFQADVFRAVNAARAQARSCGSEAKPAVAALGWNDTLFAAAAAHSQDMAQRNYFSHTSPEGKSAGDRMLLAGYRFSAWGENIAAGQPSVNVVMAGWLASDGHCRNIMNAVFTEIAVACVSTSRPMYPTYWTMVLAKPQ
jgi:uncharacterized protein YkwD